MDGFIIHCAHGATPAHVHFLLMNFSTLKMEAICSSEVLVYTRYTRYHIPEDDILEVSVIFMEFSWFSSVYPHELVDNTLK
jgi:hypothetical protein